ncbi:MAG: rhomboid family intramembrane serine protease [Myxococcales bacterium]|nr:rhomboid family intramembrane serine protease [Myxococcales bacterium]
MIGPLSDRRQAREWALVLQSQQIGYVLGWHADELARGWVLTVSPEDYAAAVDAIDLYEAENEDWPPKPIRDRPRHAPSLSMPIAMALVALFFFYVTGPADAGSGWFARGRADALLLTSQPWRMATALTLHADAQHVLGNALSASIFGAMVSRRLGAGGAVLAILLAGILGNTFNALHHLPGGHLSIGASTAVFGAVGLLAAIQTVLLLSRREGERRRLRAIDVVAPLVGGLALLGSLGAGGGNTDLWAHAYGFLAGVGLGLPLGLVVRRGSRPSRLVQAVTLIAAIVILGGSWALAIVA